MHPLWNLIPATLNAAIFVAASYCLIDETRDGIGKPNPWLLAVITATGTASAIAATISAAPVFNWVVITWTLGALS